MKIPKVLFLFLAVCEMSSASDEYTHTIPIGDFQVDVFDLSHWAAYRKTVQHPCTVYKPGDIERAMENLRRFDWAQDRLQRMEGALADWWEDSDEFFERMIPATTPGAVIFTMCPHCEYSPTHGQYDWDPKNPEKLVCKGCGMVYPNERFPEDLVMEATTTGLQRFTYYGGKSWHFYGHHIRSSWTGQIRARKIVYMADQVARFAKAYALTGRTEYARTARRVLLRFAEVYPDYLVYSGYGEYANLPPKLAAVSLKDLPVDELTLPPNKPNRILHPGYWMTGRATDTGMEGGFASNVAIAYNLTCEAVDENGIPVYSEEERVTIERDLLIESTYLMMADLAYNNKSITNRRAAALIGACVGDPMRVRFGLEAFDHMVEEWYLDDGTPGETPAYGHMTLNGILPMSEGLQGYSDPPGFQLGGGRIDNLDLYGRPAYQAVFRALTETILPNLRYPAWGDSYPHTSLGTQYAELCAARYPSERTRTLLARAHGVELAAAEASEDQEFALLARSFKGKLRESGSEYALFHRSPDLVTVEGEFSLESRFWPAWKAAYLRMGRNGLAGTAILVSSDWGGHHHKDALGLSLYWRDRECLTDLGYLWDSPNSHMTRRTFAHNLVLVDEKDQITGERVGSLHIFGASGPVQVAEMSSTAYAQCSTYRRTIVTIPLEEKGFLAVDLFRVTGGEIHDLVYHGPNNQMRLAVDAASLGETLYDLTDTKKIASAPSWSVEWDLDEEVSMTVINVSQTGEESFIGSGWGSRDRADAETTIPYVVRRRKPSSPEEMSRFITVYVCADSGHPIPTVARTTDDPDATGLQIQAHDAKYSVDFGQTGSPVELLMETAEGSTVYTLGEK